MRREPTELQFDNNAIISLATDTTPRAMVYPCNQFALHVWVTGAGGASISQIQIRGYAQQNWKPLAAAPRDRLATFYLVNGALARSVEHTFTFGIYSNTAIDLLASGGAWYGDIEIIVTNSDTVTQSYTLMLHGWALQDRKYSIQAYY
jgi:hypothetical protein